MQAIDFWNKFNLHRAKIIALLLFACSFQLSAQIRTKSAITLHRVESDQKPIKYGFMLGVHQNYYGVKYSDRFDTQEYEDINSISGITRVGFDLGFMVNFRLADQFSIRVVPVKIGLYQNIMRYYYNTSLGPQDQLVESTRIEPGVFVKYRSIRRNNNRFYIVAGASASIRSGKEEITSNSARLEISKTNYKAEIGIGFENYFQFFKFAPEIRYARGIVNVMNDTDNIFHNGIQRLITHNFTLYLHFSD